MSEYRRMKHVSGIRSGIKKQFEYTMSIPCVKEAMKFIQDDERNTIEEQKELVLIEAPTREEEKRAAVMMENLKPSVLKMLHRPRWKCRWSSKRKRQRAESID